MQVSHLVEYPTMPGAGVSLRLVCPFGSDSDGRHPGLAHFVEHMLFKGTARTQLLEFTDRTSRLGNFNAYTDFGRLVVHCTCLRHYADEALELLVEMLTEPRFDADEVERERGVIKQEIASWDADPRSYFWSRSSESLLGFAMGHFQAGTAESVDAITREDLGRWHARHVLDRYNPAAVIPGGMAVKFEHRPLTPRLPLPSWDTSPLDLTHPTKQAFLGFFSQGFPYREDADSGFITDVLCEMLGGGAQSRLYRELREKRGLCYSVHARSISHETWGMFAIEAQLGSESLEEAEQIIRQECGKLVAGDFTDEELQVAKQRQMLRYTLHFERNGAIASAHDLVFGGLPSFFKFTNPGELFAKQISEVTRDGVTETARWAWGHEVKRVRMWDQL